MADEHTRRKTVLVVDDFDDNRQMYAEFLALSGFRTAEAIDGADAIAKARDLLPDIIVMDLTLPVIDGWEATRRLKSDPRTRHIPIIALTGHALEGQSEGGAREAGCDGFLTKPCLPEQLLDAVTVMLARRSKAAARRSGKTAGSDGRKA
jgi:CheY-like chemotaxis protein